MSDGNGPPKLDDIVNLYVRLRDEKAAKKKAFEAEIDSINKGMNKIENFMLKHLQDSGSESVRTSAGTFFKKTVGRSSVGDWDECLAFIKENEAWEMLERRVSSTAVQQYREEHDALPPGVNWSEAVVVQVRRD